MDRFITFIITVLIISILTARSEAGKLTIPLANNQGYEMYAQSRALIIGNWLYTDPSWRPLTNVEKEISLIEEALEADGFDVEVANNLTAAAMATALKTFITRRVDDNTRLLVFYAGHGWSDTAANGFVVPIDGKDRNNDDVLSSMISMDDIKSWSYLSRAKHILFVFDSCFSGLAFNTRSSPKFEPVYLNLIDRSTRQFITSGKEDQLVPDDLKFAENFIAGMTGSADVYKDGLVTASELGEWIYRQMIGPKSTQTPQSGRDPQIKFSSGDMVFGSTLKSGMSVDVKVEASEGALTLGLQTQALAGAEIVVRPSTGDNSKANEALRSLNVQVTQVDQQPSPGVVDTLTCEEGAPVEAVKLIANTLARGGVPLREIRSAGPRSSEIWKYTLLSSGNDATPQGGKLTLEQIGSLSSCPSSALVSRAGNMCDNSMSAAEIDECLRR